MNAEAQAKVRAVLSAQVVHRVSARRAPSRVTHKSAFMASSSRADATPKTSTGANLRTICVQATDAILDKSAPRATQRAPPRARATASLLACRPLRVRMAAHSLSVVSKECPDEYCGTLAQAARKTD